MIRCISNPDIFAKFQTHVSKFLLNIPTWLTDILNSMCHRMDSHSLPSVATGLPISVSGYSTILVIQVNESVLESILTFSHSPCPIAFGNTMCSMSRITTSHHLHCYHSGPSYLETSSLTWVIAKLVFLFLLLAFCGLFSTQKSDWSCKTKASSSYVYPNPPKALCSSKDKPMAYRTRPLLALASPPTTLPYLFCSLAVPSAHEYPQSPLPTSIRRCSDFTFPKTPIDHLV